MCLETLSWYVPSFSVMYSFPVNSSKAKYLDKLQSRMTRICFPKLGYNRNKHAKSNGIQYQRIRRNCFSNIPTRTRYGGGRDDAETLAESRNRGEETFANCFNIYPSIQHAQEHRYLEDTKIKLSYLLDIVGYPVTDLRDFLAETNASIKVDDPCIVPVQRFNDKHITDFIQNLKKVTRRTELRRKNYCRLFLDVHIPISDITTACRQYLSRELLLGNLSFETR